MAFIYKAFQNKAILLNFSVNITVEFMIPTCKRVQWNIMHQMMFCEDWSAEDEIITSTS